MKTKNVTEKNMKVCLVGSSGGHLTHLYMLKPFWKDKNRFWVTFDKEDARSLLEGEKVYPCYFPTNRSIKALIKNTKIAWDVLHKEKPDLIISCGAAVAVPFFYKDAAGIWHMDVSKFYHGDYYLEEEVKTMRGKGIASRKKSSIQIAAAIYTQARLRTSLFCFLLYQLSMWWVKYRAQPEAISTQNHAGRNAP